MYKKSNLIPIANSSNGDNCEPEDLWDAGETIIGSVLAIEHDGGEEDDGYEHEEEEKNELLAGRSHCPSQNADTVDVSEIQAYFRGSISKGCKRGYTF